MNEFLPDFYVGHELRADEINRISRATNNNTKFNRGHGQRVISIGGIQCTIPEPTPADSITFWNNEASFDIPPYGIVLATDKKQAAPGGTFSASDPSCIRPNVSGIQPNYLINLGSTVAHQSYGQAQLSRSLIYQILYDNTDGTPNPGEAWGIQQGTSKLKKGYPGFFIIGVYDNVNFYVLAFAIPTLVMVGKAQTNIIQGTSGQFNIWHGLPAGSETFTAGDSVSAYARLQSVAAGQWAYIQWVNGGWEFMNTTCPTTTSTTTTTTA